MFCPQCGSPLPTGEQCPKCSLAELAVRPSEIIPEQTRTINELKISTLIPLAERETILWHRNLTHGIIHKEIIVE